MARVIIHGCGGAGVSITAKMLESLCDSDMVDVDTRYVDTSRADVDNFDLDKNKIYIIKNNKSNKSIDGSGGVRTTNDAYIIEEVKNYLDKLDYDSKDIHIIISSASGGSGSVIAPRLIHALKEVGAPVVYITLTDYSSVVYNKTSIDTLHHIDAMGRKYHYSIPTIIVENDEAVHIADKRVGMYGELLSVLFSASHKALDTTDIIMFAKNDYVDHSEINGLINLGLYKDDTFAKLKDLSITTLRILTDDPNFKLNTDGFKEKVGQYKIGYVSDEVKTFAENSKLPVPLYFALTPNGAIDKIRAAIEELQRSKTVVKKESLFESTDVVGGLKI